MLDMNTEKTNTNPEEKMKDFKNIEVSVFTTTGEGLGSTESSHEIWDEKVIEAEKYGFGNPDKSEVIETMIDQVREYLEYHIK